MLLTFINLNVRVKRAITKKVGLSGIAVNIFKRSCISVIAGVDFKKVDKFLNLIQIINSFFQSESICAPTNNPERGDTMLKVNLILNSTENLAFIVNWRRNRMSSNISRESNRFPKDSNTKLFALSLSPADLHVVHLFLLLNLLFLLTPELR